MTVSLAPDFRPQFFLDDGTVASGAKVFFYVAGTSTKENTYSDAAGAVPNANPIILDAYGRPDNSGTEISIYLTDGVTYDIKICPSDDTDPPVSPYRTIEDITGQHDLIAKLANTSNTAYGDALIGVKRTISGAVAHTLHDRIELEEIRLRADFDAAGDGSTNDTSAFDAAADYINAADGGIKLIIESGTYIVGSQTFAGSTGLGYAYQAADILYIHDCTKPVVIECQGAIIKFAAGLKFGSFDPTTGNVYNPVLPFTNADYRADIGIAFRFYNNSSIVVQGNFEIDGNMSNISLGGEWGDTGYQCLAYGIHAYDNDMVDISNGYIHHHGTDGIVIGYVGLTETSKKYPHTLRNVVSEYNGRQGLSWVGGTQLTAINCNFNHTGQGTFFSSPGAGVDIEAESSVCRNGTFINCEMQNNIGQGMVADSGDSADVTFIDCKFIGQSNYAIWPNKPRFSFKDCLIVGAYVNSYYSSTNPEDATKYDNCLFTDESKYAATLDSIGSLGDNLSGSDTQTNVTYNGCRFIATRSRLGRFDAAKLINCYMRQEGGTGYVNDQDYFIGLTGTYFENLTIDENITVNAPANAYYAIITSTSRWQGRNYINSATPYIRWFSWSTGAGGYDGYLGQHDAKEKAYSYLSVGTGLGSGEVGYYGTNEIYYTSSIPAAGTFKQGDFVFNTAPALDGNNMTLLGWSRLTDGSGHVSGTDWALCYVSHVTPAT